MTATQKLSCLVELTPGMVVTVHRADQRSFFDWLDRQVVETLASHRFVTPSEARELIGRVESIKAEVKELLR